LQRLRDDDRLLEDFLAHEVGVIALVDPRRRGARSDDLALHRLVGAVEDPHLVALDHDPVALVEISDALREAGTKWDLFKNRLLLSGAVFRVDKTNARTPGLPGEEPIVLSGKQRVDGIELSATGYFTKFWSILASYTFLESEIVASNTAPVLVNGVRIFEVGKRLINTPKNSFNLWTTYQFPFRLSVGGGAKFIDRRYGNTINTRFVEGYWTFDATASYRVNKHTDLRLNGYNLTDKYYFDRITGGQVVPGAARSVVFAVNFHF
jgi:catecholate siderophore receptor